MVRSVVLEDRAMTWIIGIIAYIIVVVLILMFIHGGTK